LAKSNNNFDTTIDLLNFYFYTKPLTDQNLASIYNDILIFIREVPGARKDSLNVLEAEKMIKFLIDPNQLNAKEIAELVTNFYHRLTSERIENLQEKLKICPAETFKKEIDKIIMIVQSISKHKYAKNFDLIGIIDKISDKLDQTNNINGLMKMAETIHAADKYLRNVSANLTLAQEKIQPKKDCVKTSSWNIFGKSSKNKTDTTQFPKIDTKPYGM
jgi:hypothetical protein